MEKNEISLDAFSIVEHFNGSTHSTEVRAEIVPTLKNIGQRLGIYLPDEQHRRIAVGGLPEMPTLELQANIGSDNAPTWDTEDILTADPEQIEAFTAFQKILGYAISRTRSEA